VVRGRGASARMASATISNEMPSVKLVATPSHRSSKTAPKTEGVLLLAELPERARKMLATLDLDGDGTLTVSELSKAGALLRAQHRWLRYMRVGLVGALAFIALLAVSDLATSIAAVHLAKEVKLERADDPQRMGVASALLSAHNRGPVLVGSLKYEADLATLPTLGPSPFMALDKVVLTESSGEVRGFDVDGFLWHNRSAATLFLSSRYTLLIRDGALDLSGTPAGTAGASAHGRALRHGRQLDWCLCCCTFTSGHAQTTVSNTGVGTANVGAGNGDSASIASNNQANVASGNSASASGSHWWRR